jgi:hypothetical protein
VRTAVAEAEHGGRVVHHLADRVCDQPGVVQHRHEEELAAIPLEQAVVEQLGRVDPLSWANLGALSYHRFRLRMDGLSGMKSRSGSTPRFPASRSHFEMPFLNFLFV